MKFNEFSKKTLNEMYGYTWHTTDPLEIRSSVIEGMLEWFEEEGMDDAALLPELLAAYLTALNITPNESPKIAALMKKAIKMCVNQYQEMHSEGALLESSEEFIAGVEKLKQMGVFPDIMTALIKSVRATVKSDLDQWAKDNPDTLEEEVWDNPNPKKKHKKLSPAKKAAAKARAKRAGRPYPNLIDNMWASKK